MAGKGTYSDLGHEYGHVRGAQDLYQYMIPAENNPVSHVAYDYPKCNMGTGYQEWSDYCSAIFNHNAQYKQITADMTRSTYPKQMLVRVTKDGNRYNVPQSIFGAHVPLLGIYMQNRAILHI